MKDLQIDALSKAVKHTSLKHQPQPNSQAQKAQAIEVDFIDKQGFLRYLDSNETKIKNHSHFVKEVANDVKLESSSKIYMKYLPQKPTKAVAGEYISFGE